MALEDFHTIRDLRDRESHLFANIEPAVEPKKIILYSMDPWQLGVVEQFLHVAFQLKGHNPKTLCDDGLLPLSAWENHNVQPPEPGTLEKRAHYICGAFGIVPVGLSNYLDRDEAHQRATTNIEALPLDQLSTVHYRGVPIGSLVLRDLFQYTVGHFEPRSKEDILLNRNHLVHAVMSVDLAYAIIEAENPDIVVLVNGKSVMFSYMYEVCRLIDVQVTTWEEGMYWDTSIVLANNDLAIDFPVRDEDWDAFCDIPFDDCQRKAVEDYFGRWRRQEATHYVFYDDEVRDYERIQRELRIPTDKRLISIFTNIVSDTNALGKDGAFAGMMDWIYSTVEYVRHRPELVLVIRAHPCEVKWLCRTRTPVRALLLERLGGCLPDNVRIVDGESQLSSYEIAAHSDCCAVYTSTLGVELSMMGFEPLVCGVPFYANRGLVNDIQSQEEYFAFLSGRQRPSGVNADLLKQFMYFVIFLLVRQPEFLVGIHTDPRCPKVRIDTFEGFPRNMPIFNDVVESILENRSFIRLEQPV